MKAEILFPEVCNLYGDLQNIYYLKRCCPALEIIETDLHSKPRFLTEDVALVYMVQHPTRNLNAHVKRERAVADRNQMAVSRGKNPAAKGGLGAVLGLAKETPDGCGITDIAVCVVDGKRYLPDVFYDVNGNEVLI